MANANTQLQSILAQFAGRSDVTPDQEAQLRATIASDPDLTQRLNQEAASGHLKGFLPGVGGSEPLTGSYDKASGIVTLPAFEPDLRQQRACVVRSGCKRWVSVLQLVRTWM